ncbi:hypothetical protein ACFQ7F_20450 [Streptomyces sp. NPDC056486]|uniref:hypothetical protein n=1 Tax=Streptomyces sp. NPDC056486 TaxID=3345835 RepID=UPI0036791723
MLTVLVPAAERRASELIPQIETVPGVYVISYSGDSFLALARARAPLPDVLVIDQARRLQPPGHILVHAGDTVVGTVSPTAEVPPPL